MSRGAGGYDRSVGDAVLGTPRRAVRCLLGRPLRCQRPPFPCLQPHLHLQPGGPAVPSWCVGAVCCRGTGGCGVPAKAELRFRAPVIVRVRLQGGEVQRADQHRRAGSGQRDIRDAEEGECTRRVTMAVSFRLPAAACRRGPCSATKCALHLHPPPGHGVTQRRVASRPAPPRPPAGPRAAGGPRQRDLHPRRHAAPGHAGHRPAGRRARAGAAGTQRGSGVPLQVRLRDPRQARRRGGGSRAALRRRHVPAGGRAGSC